RLSRAGVVRLSSRTQCDRVGNALDAAYRLGRRQRAPDVFGEQSALATSAQVSLRATSLPLAAVHECRLGNASDHGRQTVDFALAGGCPSTGGGNRRRVS